MAGELAPSGVPLMALLVSACSFVLSSTASEAVPLQTAEGDSRQLLGAACTIHFDAHAANKGRLIARQVKSRIGHVQCR